MTTLGCAHVVGLVTDYLEHTLDPGTVSDFEAHLQLCPGCEVYLEQIRSTIAQLGQVPLSTLSDEAVRTLVDAFRDVRP